MRVHYVMLCGMATDTDEWVTLQDAAEQTGISISAMRKWYRNGLIEARDADGGRKVVRVADVQERMAVWRESTVPRPVRLVRDPPREEARVSVAVAVLLRSLESLAAALDANTVMVGRLAESEEARRRAEAVVEALSGSKYAAATLIEGVRA